MSAALDRFFEHYYRRRPVNATFTGVHAYDELLPDWSLAGLAALDDEMRSFDAELGHRADGGALDAELARAFLEIQLAENASMHGMRGNPALWTGEAVFSVIALMIRDATPLDERIAACTARLAAIPAFLSQAFETMGTAAISPRWTAKARRDCNGAVILLDRGIGLWLDSAPHDARLDAPLRAGASRARDAFEQFSSWLAGRPSAPDRSLACGPELYDLLLARGHACARSRGDLLADARDSFGRARARLDAMAANVAGSWPAAQERLAADHPVPNEYLDSFSRTWDACRERAVRADIVTWPDWPIRYVPFPSWTREAAPFLYYLYYRSPAPFDPRATYDYVVPPLPHTIGDLGRHLRAWNHSVIKLNHVVHHGAIGHHVQNGHAYHQTRSRIGQIAAVDCANRIGMFCAGTMAEGWACYATELMEELGFLTPLDSVSQQHSRVRFLARAIVDIELHQGTMSFDDGVRFYVEQVGMSADAAGGEVVKNSMFPCTAVMYWLGLQGILDLRATLKAKRGSAWSLKAFHDELLGYGSIPILLIARLMTTEKVA